MFFVSGVLCTSKTRLDGKTVIITGANAGIGKETAVDLARYVLSVTPCLYLGKAVLVTVNGGGSPEIPGPSVQILNPKV